MVYVDFKDLSERIAADIVLLDKAFKIALNPKYYGYQRSLSSILYNASGDTGGAVKNKKMQNK